MFNKQKTAIIITSISHPTSIIFDIAEKANMNSWDFIVVGDAKSPNEFKVNGCTFYSLDEQLKSDFLFAQFCPQNHYARKNLGYLYVIAKGNSCIIETDDDNIPLESFWQSRKAHQTVPHIIEHGWVNVYRYFTKKLSWPRGFPLRYLKNNIPSLEKAVVRNVYCPIQQGLADDNPDVDAIYRLVFTLPLRFENHLKVALGKGSRCPFNSQNTTWFPDAYPLLYLPAYCSFRMTDIFRSFIAQIISWTNEWSILFHEPTVYQVRNEHDLMNDFKDEVIGYINNEKIFERLGTLSLKPGVDNIPNNMKLCYDEMVRLGVVDKEELSLLDYWLTDLAKLSL